MSIRNDIDKMLKEGVGMVKISDIAYLDYLTTNAFEQPCDTLMLTFNHVAGIDVRTFEIKSRDFEGIIKEIKDYTKKFFLECAKKGAVDNV